MSRTGWRARLGDLAAYLVLIAAILVALFPVFWTVSTSIKDRVTSFAIPPAFFDFVPVSKNYLTLFSSPAFQQVYLNTIVVTIGSTLLTVLAGSACAYALSRHARFTGRRPLEVSLILVRAIPTVVLMVPLFKIVVVLGLYDNLWFMMILYAAINLPFAVWLMTSFVDQIPRQLEESALVDGASRLVIVTRIVLPLAAPGMAATTVFVALLAWNEFLIPVMLAGEQAKTLPVYIAGFISARNLDWGPMAAASSLAIIPIALLTVAIQRFLVSGLSSGAVKE
ncbi:MAG: carbohydrate ABC transporter permease [Pseudomonadota bacterium]